MSLSVRLFSLSCVAVLVAGACSKTANPAVCCTDPADCASIGAEEDNRPCPTALACVDHECVVPDCSMDGCPAMEPVCNLASNRCEGCTSNADCANFPDQERCLVEDGSCVQCIVSADCGPTVPFCEGHRCRKCERDSECASGACGDDGMCLAEDVIAYIDPLGDDAAQCTKAAPCRRLTRAITQTTAIRNHIVMAPATYAIVGAITVFPSDTPAQTLIFHGNGASIVGNSSDPIIISQIPVTIRDLTIQQQLDAAAIELSSANAFSTLERVTIDSPKRGMSLLGQTRLRDVTLKGGPNSGLSRGIEIANANVVELDRVTVHGYDRCILNIGTQNVGITARNVVAYDCAVRAAELPKSSGLIEFSTLVTQGPGDADARAIDCGSGALTLRASIVWTPGAVLPAKNCTLVTSIVGPSAVVGASNADPQFEGLATNNFRLKAGSPARDAIDTGPANDVVGNPRPAGARFDFGAYEQ